MDEQSNVLKEELNTKADTQSVLFYNEQVLLLKENVASCVGFRREALVPQPQKLNLQLQSLKQELNMKADSLFHYHEDPIRLLNKQYNEKTQTLSDMISMKADEEAIAKHIKYMITLNEMIQLQNGKIKFCDLEEANISYDEQQAAMLNEKAKKATTPSSSSSSPTSSS